MRRQIAERMVNSQHTSPHVLTVMEADLSKVLAHRAANKAAFAAQGVNLTLTAYFCSAIVSGLKTCPDVNSSWTDEGIQRYRAINLGMATSLGEEGLIVPVIKDADLLSLQGLAQKINDLSARARGKKLLPDEVKGGTFTLTNHGSGGSLFASPIIFQPQAAILGTGMMQKRAVVVTDASGNDAIAIRPMIYLSLVFDHRILDGVTGDRFLVDPSVSFMAVITPPFQTPDELAHYYRAYHIADFRWIAKKTPLGMGDELPQSLYRIAEELTGAIPFHPQQKISVQKIITYLSIPLDESVKTFVSFPTTALSSPVIYIPQALGIATGKPSSYPP